MIIDILITTGHAVELTENEIVSYQKQWGIPTYEKAMEQLAFDKAQHSLSEGRWDGLVEFNVV